MAAPSMPALFRACVEVLADSLSPWHYADLAAEALRRLGLAADADTLRRAKEDVREKMLEAGRFGTAYTGPPHYLAVLSRWFPSAQRELLNPATEPIIVRAHAGWAIDGCLEALLRSKHMVTKIADTPARWEGMARGMILERHVAGWFRDQWPDSWAPPDNAGRWREWCNHDFKLRLYGRAYLVDVMGPLRDGMFGLPAGGGKRLVDLHVVARQRGADVAICGFQHGKALAERFGEEETIPICRLAVRLNCEARGWDYRAVAASIS